MAKAKFSMFYCYFILYQFGCNDGEFNAMAALWFQLLEGTVRSLFHDTPGIIIYIYYLVYNSRH